MGSRSVSDIEQQLENLKRKEAALKDEMNRKRKLADERERKVMIAKKLALADRIIEIYGENVLDDYSFLIDV